MDYENIFTGLLLIAAGAFTAGSFAVPFGRMSGWKWESCWLIYSLGAYILFPMIACVVFAKGLVVVYSGVPHDVLLRVFISGIVYGIGNLSFGLTLRYLGISLGYALSLGLMLAIGTLVPPLMDGRLSLMFQGPGGRLLVLGVLISCAGIALSAWAGHMKDKIVSCSERQSSVAEFQLVKGISAAVLVGFTGSAMSLGFEQGIPVAECAVRSGVDPLFATMPVMVLLLSGTMVTTLVWCIWLGIKHRSLGDYSGIKPRSRLAMNYLLAMLAGILWFSQFVLFGMGKSKMGRFTFTSWGILMALTIVFATLWGLYRKEWKGAPASAYVLMAVSLLILIGSSFLIGISGSM
ncbi:MAG TPA: L-rhamnose/proton symporter RhaT [Acidobacteriota bacterium]|nr:L-rhamnose/proton symporter RhaT [Acidobacteriota bacterium]